MPKKVMISGCFDLLHSGHVAFFNEAAQFGDLYVAIGSDKTIFQLKGRATVNSEQERLYLVKSISSVKDAFISRGSGMLDFIEEIHELKPDIFVVNEDGNIPEKKQMCEELGIKYVILKREPSIGLQARSTTDLREVQSMPYRIDLAGGWLDQPFVSRFYPGSVITISIHPTIEFNERSGMASSTRRAAIDMWGPRLPQGNPEKLSKILFCYDNPPGTEEISGSQDAIGIVHPGLSKSYYDGEYWPVKIESIQDESILSFIEQSVFLIPLSPRHTGFSVLRNTHVKRAGAKALADATDACWDAIMNKNVGKFGEGVKESFEAQIAMFPDMVTDSMMTLLDEYRHLAQGWKVSGAGGGGYLILVSEEQIENAVRINIRRLSD